MLERRHYQQIAEIIGELQRDVPEYKKTLDQLIAVKLRERNANFNEDRFLDAVKKVREG